MRTVMHLTSKRSYPVRLVLVLRCTFIYHHTLCLLIVVALLSTVLPAKSDSDVLFVYEVIRDLESIDHLCINPIHRIGLIHR